MRTDSAEKEAAFGTERGMLPVGRVCFSLQELLRAIESKETGFSERNLYGLMLVELIRYKVLKSFAKRIEKQILLGRSRV